MAPNELVQGAQNRIIVFTGSHGPCIGRVYGPGRMRAWAAILDTESDQVRPCARLRPPQQAEQHDGV